MPKPLSLPFDPIARADELWQQRWGPVPSMAAITSIMRAHQILLAEVDAVVKPYGLTFARYEALVLLTFSKAGELPMSKIGERLMVHPTSVTNTVDRLVRSGLVDKRPNPNDGRGTLASITEKGREVVRGGHPRPDGDGLRARRVRRRGVRGDLRDAAPAAGGGARTSTSSSRSGRAADGPSQGPRPARRSPRRPVTLGAMKAKCADPLPGDGLRHRRHAAGAVHRHDRRSTASTPARATMRGLADPRCAVHRLPGLRLRPGLQGEVAVRQAAVGAGRRHASRSPRSSWSARSPARSEPLVADGSAASRQGLSRAPPEPPGELAGGLPSTFTRTS